MAKIEGIPRLIHKIEAESLRRAKSAAYNVTFVAPYAVYVHEDLNAYHSNGQAKYLSTAAKRKTPEVKRIIRRFLKNKKGLDNGIYEACELVLETAQQLVPVDTGFLKRSGRIVKASVGGPGGPVIS